MNIEIINKIKEDVNKVKVIDYKEEEISADTFFLGLKKGSYLLNNGQTIVREGINKKIGSKDSVCVFAVTKDKKILIVIQPRVAIETITKVNIELPAGYKEDDEEASESALRELVEETGYTTDNIVLIDSYYTSVGFCGERTDLLLALDCIKIGEQKLDNDEFVCYEEVTLDEFEYLLNNNYIMDANARIGYYRYLEYLMKEGY